MLIKKKCAVAAAAAMLVFSLAAAGPDCLAGETRFVRPSVEVPVRRGQGREYKIVKLVRDGDQVELLKEGDSWARVRVASGAEGWMPKRFLSRQAPPTRQVQILQAANDKLKQENDRLRQQMEELSTMQSTTGNELSTCIAQRDEINTRFQTLQADTADVMAIRNEADTAKKDLQQLQTALQDIRQQNEDLRRKTALSWFLAGGGVLLVGWIIGLITCRSKKRRPSLL
jgi:SH3 domain protein